MLPPGSIPRSNITELGEKGSLYLFHSHPCPNNHIANNGAQTLDLMI